MLATSFGIVEGVCNRFVSGRLPAYEAGARKQWPQEMTWRRVGPG